MDDARDNALDYVLTALPQLESPVIECVETCASMNERAEPEAALIRKIFVNHCTAECADDLHAINEEFGRKKKTQGEDPETDDKEK